MTILHANWLAEPGAAQLVCMISYFHAPIWEFAHERCNCSCKAENAGVEAFFRVRPFLVSGPVLIWLSFCWIFCNVIYIRVLFIIMHFQYVELSVSLVNVFVTMPLTIWYVSTTARKRRVHQGDFADVSGCSSFEPTSGFPLWVEVVLSPQMVEFILVIRSWNYSCTWWIFVLSRSFRSTLFYHFIYFYIIIFTNLKKFS